MRLSDYRLKIYLGAKKTVPYQEERLQETIQKSRMAFIESESESFLSSAGFLYQQSKYIHKRWWILQGMILLLLWWILNMTQSSYYIQRCMGIAASLFAVLLLPELWKNRNSNALEIECVSYYSLRQIYAARIFALGLADLLLLGCFFLASVLTVKIFAADMMVQFFLPYIVTCCICFRTLYSVKAGSEAFALLLCIVWCVIWTQIVLDEKIYGAISLSVWCVMTIAAVCYLGYCIWRGQNDYKKIWEANT